MVLLLYFHWVYLKLSLEIQWGYCDKVILHSFLIFVIQPKAKSQKPLSFTFQLAHNINQDTNAV